MPPNTLPTIIGELADHPAIKNPKTMPLALYIFCSVTWEDTTHFRAGEMETSRKDLVRISGLSDKTVRTILSMLEDVEFIEMETAHSGRTIKLHEKVISAVKGRQKGQPFFDTNVCNDGSYDWRDAKKGQRYPISEYGSPFPLLFPRTPIITPIIPSEFVLKNSSSGQLSPPLFVRRSSWEDECKTHGASMQNQASPSAAEPAVDKAPPITGTMAKARTPPIKKGGTIASLSILEELEPAPNALGQVAVNLPETEGAKTGAKSRKPPKVQLYLELFPPALQLHAPFRAKLEEFVVFLGTTKQRYWNRQMAGAYAARLVELEYANNEEMATHVLQYALETGRLTLFNPDVKWLERAAPGLVRYGHVFTAKDGGNGRFCANGGHSCRVPSYPPGYDVPYAPLPEWLDICVEKEQAEWKESWHRLVRAHALDYSSIEEDWLDEVVAQQFWIYCHWMEAHVDPAPLRKERRNHPSEAERQRWFISESELYPLRVVWEKMFPRVLESNARKNPNFVAQVADFFIGNRLWKGVMRYHQTVWVGDDINMRLKNMETGK